MTKRFLFTILTILLILIGTGIAIFFAKGYRFSPDEIKIVAGTGIISITSVPDQASVYLDDHLSTATNANINSLPPKTYKVRIIKEGYIPWEKDIEVKEGLVSEIKATLFPSIPSIYPLTYSGVEKVTLSPDEQRISLVIPGNDKKNGIWVWEMSERPIGFARGREPHQVALPEPGIDFTKAEFRWSPDSSQILVILPEKAILLDVSLLNDPAQDITAILQPTIISWNEDEKNKKLAQLETLNDSKLRQVASESAILKWSPDETKILFGNSKIADKQSNDPEKIPDLEYKIYDLETDKEHKLPDSLSYRWLSDSRHLISVTESGENSGQKTIHVVEFDGFNQAALYAGNFDKDIVYTWPDASRLVIVTSLSIPTASKPNLFGINLK